MFYLRVLMHIDARDETLSQTFCFIIGYPRISFADVKDLVNLISRNSVNSFYDGVRKS